MPYFSVSLFFRLRKISAATSLPPKPKAKPKARASMPTNPVTIVLMISESNIQLGQDRESRENVDRAFNDRSQYFAVFDLQFPDRRFEDLLQNIATMIATTKMAAAITTLGSQTITPDKNTANWPNPRISTNTIKKTITNIHLMMAPTNSDGLT